MLVLSRKPGQRILIGEDVEVQVVAMRGSCVKLGITAPSDVRVRRGELPSFDDARHTAEKASRPLAGALSDSQQHCDRATA